MCESIEGLRNKFLDWMEAFESKGLKVNLGKTKVMVCGSIAKDGMSKSKVDPCGVYSQRVKANSVLCVQCCMWIHGRCARVKIVTPMFSRNCACRKCEGNIVEVVELEETLCDEVETVEEFSCHGDRVSAGGGCKAAVTAGRRCGWVPLRECGELLYGRMFPMKLKGAIYKSYVMPAVLYGSEAWCLKECEMGILQRTERSTLRTICGVQLKNIRSSTDMMSMLGLEETMDHLAMANRVRWYGHVLRREDGHVFRRSLDFAIEGQRKKWRPKRTWKKQVEEESMNVGFRRKDALCRSMWSVGQNKIAAGLR